MLSLWAGSWSYRQVRPGNPLFFNRNITPKDNCRADFNHRGLGLYPIPKREWGWVGLCVGGVPGLSTCDAVIHQTFFAILGSPGEPAQFAFFLSLPFLLHTGKTKYTAPLGVNNNSVFEEINLKQCSLIASYNLTFLLKSCKPIYLSHARKQQTNPTSQIPVLTQFIWPHSAATRSRVSVLVSSCEINMISFLG